MHYQFPLLVLLISLLISVFSACSPGGISSETVTVNNSIKGVWEYIEDDVLNEIRGMSFFTDEHFAFIVNYRKDSLDTEAKVLAYSGTYQLVDSSVNAKILHAHDPALIGHNMRWIHHSDGEVATYKVLNKEGDVVETGKVKRLE